MIYDCFSFFNELDLLEIRLNVLKDVVDKFVLVEAGETHTGRPKPLYFKENEERFAAFRDRIVHVVVDDFSIAESAMSLREKAWTIENLQRNAIVRGLSGAAPCDTILISDLDEVPRPEMVRRAVGLPGITRFGMRTYNYFLNYRNYTSDQWLLATQALSYSTFCNPATYDGFKFGEYVVEKANPLPSASIVRFLRPTRTFKDAGWHFTYMGGVEAIRNKIRSIAHTEFDTEGTTSDAWIRARIDAGEDLFKRGDRFFADKVDASFPSCIADNQGRYSDWLYPVDDEYLRRTRGCRMRAKYMGVAKRFVARCVPDFMIPCILRIQNRLNGIRSDADKM